ncbi:MAG: transporter substrate-binding domain-containing protein [Motiliproteus sp.]
MLRLFILFFSMLMLLSAFPSWAENKYDTLILYPPVKPLKYNIMINILKHLDANGDYGFRFDQMPWKRVYSKGLIGQGAVLGLSKNQQRMALFDYSDELYVDEILLVTLKGKEFEFSSIQDLQGKVVGGNAGSSYGDTFEKGKEEVFQYVGDYRGASSRLKKLLKGRIDLALISPGRQGLEQAITADPELSAKRHLLVPLNNPLVRDANFLGFAKDMKAGPLLQRLNRDLAKARNSGAIDQIIQKQLSKSRQ